MQVLKLNRDSEDFYRYLGPVLGSRIVEQETHDRFYDDPGKEWYLIPSQDVAAIIGAASVLNNHIRNFWAADIRTAEALLDTMLANYNFLEGVVPNTYESVFDKMHFTTHSFRKNFIKVYYHEKH